MKGPIYEKFLSPFTALCSVGFFARLSYALARSPVLPLFALYLGAGPEAIGFAVGVSTVTGIFFKLPAGASSDVIGRKRTMLIGLALLCLYALYLSAGKGLQPADCNKIYSRSCNSDLRPCGHGGCCGYSRKQTKGRCFHGFRQ